MKNYLMSALTVGVLGVSAVSSAAVKSSHSVLPFGDTLSVITSPILGVPQYDASDVLAQTSSINEDLTLLKQHRELRRYLANHGYKQSHPVVELSGALEGQVFGTSGYNRTKADGVTLSRADFDVNAFASSWAGGFFSFAFNNSPKSTGSRDPVSTVFLKRGFLTIGNLQESPVYLSVGKTYVPFGRFSSAMLTPPVTLSVARILNTTIILGYSKNDFYAQLFAYPGDRTSGGTKTFKQSGVNVGYSDKAFDVGVSAVTNIADSQGMQSTGFDSTGTNFNGFAGNGTANNNLGNALTRNTPAYDVHMKINLHPVTLVGEYVATTRAFSANDLQFNGAAADISALHVELDYGFQAVGHAITAGFSYGQTKQALALMLPKHSYTVDLQTSLFSHTMVGIEYRADKDYARNDTSSGRTNAAAPAVANGPAGTGDYRHSLLLQIGAYF